MAKQKKFTLDDFSFDKELDAPNFDFDLKPPKDTRKPILKVASGFKEGVSESVRSNAFIKQLVVNALPRGYGSAYDLAEKSASTLKSLYDDTTKEIRPFMNDLKRVTARLLPKVEEVMPKQLADQVKTWTKTADANPTSSNYNPREAEIAEMLAGMVGAQAQIQQKTNSDNDVKDRLREGLEQVRHRDKLKQMDSLRLGISQLVDYQTNVTANYHRKSLELQYRHYFVALDALEEAKRSNAESRQFLQAIVHNTGLPEQVKLKASDTFKDMAKKQAMGLVGNAIFGRTNEFVSNLTGNLKKTASGRIKNAFGHGRGLLDGANGIMDANDMAEAMGMKTDPYHAAGQMGGLISSEIGAWLSKRLKPHADKIPGIRKLGNKLQYGAENIPQMLGEWARSSKHEGGISDSLVRFLKANVRMSTGMKTGIQKDTVGGMNEPSFFSRQASKSLTEIIPGYLARMLRELQIIRTGDAKTELTHYDYTKNKFDTQSAVRKNAFDSLVKGSEKQWTTQDMEGLLDQVDPKKTLNPEQRKALGQQLLRNNVKGRLGGVEVLGKTGKYDGSAQPHADQFSKLFREHFKNDTDASKKHAFAEKYNNLGAYANASREGIQNFANLGQTDFLDHAGLLHPDGDKANLERYFQYFYGDDYNPGEEGQHTFTGQPVGKMNRPQSHTGHGFKGRSARTPQAHFSRPARTQHAARDQNVAPQQFEVKSDNTDLIAAIKANSVVEPTAKMLEAITRIEDRINKGLPTFSVGSVQDGTVPAAAASTGKKGWWWNRSIKDAAGSVGSGVLGAGRKLASAGNWLVGGGFGAMNTVTRTLGGFAGKLGQGMLDKARGFRDVYSEETGPRKILLFAARLKAGEYFDAASGKPIKSWKDIHGAVADKTGIVMTDEQASTAYVRDTLGTKAIKGLGAIVGAGTKLGNMIGGKILGGLPLSLKLVSGVGKAVLSLASGYMNGPQDVYVHDKDHPKRLRKALDSRTMRAGGYSSGVTDKPIKGPKDIDGEVYNHKGVTVLDDEEFKAGLYDKDGNKLKTGLGRLFNGATKILGAGFGAFKWLADGVNKGVGNMFGLGKGLMGGFAGLFGHSGIFFGGGKKLMNTVEEIRDLLKDRMPVPHKTRKGSIEDQHKTRKEELEEAWKKHLGGQEGGEKKSGGIMSLLGGLLGRKKKEDADKDDGKGGLVDDIESGIGQSVGEKILGKGGKVLRKIPGVRRLFGKGAGAAAEAAEGAIGGAAKRGLGSRVMGGLKMGKGLGAGLALGAAGSLANATGHTTIGSGLDMAGTAATGWSLASGAAGLLGVEGGALGLAGAAGGALLTGLGALIASPVLLPALGIAAAGAALYGGYKLLTRNSLDDLSKVRYAQYGWKPDDTSHVHTVFGFEQALIKSVTYEGGMATINAKKIDFKSVVEGLGVDLQDKDQVNAFATWYQNRFKPVFITHLTVLNRIKPGVDLSDVNDKLSAAEKKQYLDGIKMPAGPYNTMISPFSGESSVSADAATVKSVMDDASAKIDKDAKDGKDKKPEDKTAQAGMAAASKVGGAAVAAAAGGVAASEAVKGINDAAKGPGAGSNVLNKAVAGVAAATGTMAGIAAGQAIKAASNGQVGAMDAIRFKTYGLMDLDADKVRSLRQLEDLVQADVKINNKQATWDGDSSDLVAKIAPQFGFSGNRNNRAYDWLAWFNKRFLPTYLTYVTAVCSVTDKKDPKSAMSSIKPDDLLTAAKAVVSAHTDSYGSTTSVWQIPVSPWEGYKLNSESASTDGNMATLKQQQKTTTLPEQAAFKKSPTAANDGAKNQSQDAKPAGKSWMDSMKDTVSNAWDSTKKFAGNAWQGAKDAGSAALSAAGSAASAVGSGLATAGKAVGSAASAVVSGAGDVLNKGYQAAKAGAGRIGATISASAGAIKSALLGALKAAGITDPTETAMFMAQMDTESGGFKSLSENLNYRPATLMSLFKTHFSGAGDAQQVAAEGPEAIANRIYGGRMGNKEAGDGWKYRGRGVVQLTGKDNYAKFGKLAGLDLVNNPDLASDPANAAKIAIAYWKSRVSSAAAKSGDVLSVTKAINGGTIGLSDRAAKFQSYLAQAKQGLLGGKPDPNAKPADGQAAAAPGSAPGAAPGAPAATASAGGSAGGAGGGSAAGGAIIKVADQTPGPAPAMKGSDAPTGNAAPAPSDAPAGPTPGSSVTPDTASALGGFSNRNKDLAAQGQYQSDSLNKTLGPVSDVLKQSLDVQKQMLTALQTIAASFKGGMPGTPAATPAKPGQGSASPDAMARKNPQPITTPPVSMSKMV